jgi:hypothetical protein
MNVIAIAALADHIASYFSYDASTWRPKYVSTPREQPIRVRWRASQHSTLVDALVEALRIRTAAPYRDLERPIAEAVVNEGDEDPAQVIVSLRDEVREEDGPGVGYELTFANSPETWPGWFAVRAI